MKDSILKHGQAVSFDHYGERSSGTVLEYHEDYLKSGPMYIIQPSEEMSFQVALPLPVDRVSPIGGFSTLEERLLEVIINRKTRIAVIPSTICAAWSGVILQPFSFV